MERKDIALSDLADYLKDIGLQYMATIGLDGRPKVRPMQFMDLYDGKLWFCTNSKKAIYAELQHDPHIELCASRLENDEMQSRWVRLSATAVFEENDVVARTIIEHSPIVHTLYSGEAPLDIFRVFYLKDIEGSMNNLGHIKGLKNRKEFGEVVHFSF